MLNADQLIAGIKSGDDSTLELLYTSERNPFLAWARKQFGCNESDAKDLYQIIVLIVYDNIQMGKLEHLHCSIKSYMYAIAKNKWKEWCRTRQREQKMSTTYIPVLLDEPHESYSDELLKTLKCGLQRLGNPCQQLLESYYYQKMNMTEIASEMGYKNPSTAKNLKYKCLQRLKKMVGDKEARAADLTRVNHS